MFDSCIMKWSISNQFWTHIFLILPISIQRSFFIVLENDIMQRTLEVIYYLSRIWVKKSTIQKRIDWFYTYSKNHRIPSFYSGDIAKYVTLPQSRIGQFIHLTSLFYRQWTKCIVFMLMPQCNQACNTFHVTWHERQRFILDVETAIFV